MCLFSHILVLLDCSSVDDPIIERIIKIAGCGKAQVTLVHVVHSHTLDQDRALKEKSDECMRTRIKQFARSRRKPYF